MTPEQKAKAQTFWVWTEKAEKADPKRHRAGERVWEHYAIEAPKQWLDDGLIVDSSEYLLKSYRETLYQLQKVKIEADKKRDKARESLGKLPTYVTLAELKQAEENCEAINGFISNVMYVITWLSRGYAPGPRRGIHRRSRQQLEVVMDPIKMQSYANPAACGSPTTISDSERFMLDEAMHSLNERERECYAMKYGQCFSERQIAGMLNISQQAVNKHIQKAEKKINESIKSNLFLQIS